MAYDDDSEDPTLTMATPEMLRAARVAALRGQGMPQMPQAGPSAPAEMLLLSNPLTAHMGQQALQQQEHAYQRGLEALKLANEQQYRQAEVARQQAQQQALERYQQGELEYRNKA